MEIMLICRIATQASEYKPLHLESNTYKWTLSTFSYCCYDLLIRCSVTSFSTPISCFYVKLSSPVRPSFYTVNLKIPVNSLQKCLSSCQTFPPKQRLKRASSPSRMPLKILKTDQKYNSWRITEFQWWGLITYRLIGEFFLEFIRKWMKVMEE